MIMVESANPHPRISPDLLDEVSVRLSRIQEISLSGSFPYPSELSASLALLRAAVHDQPTDCAPIETSLTFDSQLYSDAEELEEARRVKSKREKELQQLKEESHRLRTSVHSRLSDFKAERSLRPSFASLQDLQRVQVSPGSFSRTLMDSPEPSLKPYAMEQQIELSERRRPVQHAEANNTDIDEVQLPECRMHCLLI